MREATNPLATYADARRSNKALCTTSTTCSASERTHEPPVVAESITNPHLTPTNIDGKYIVLDILAKSANGDWINIEMQMKKRETWSSRSIYYLSKAMAGQLARGGKYDSIKPVIGIHLLAYDLLPDEDQALWCYEMLDRNRPWVKLGSELQVNVVELAKLDRMIRAGQASHLSTALRAWITYFQHWQEESIMNQIDYAPVQQALAQLHSLSADEETRRLADRREMALVTEMLETQAAEARGKAEGRAEVQQELLQTLIADGMPEAKARALLHLPAH